MKRGTAWSVHTAVVFVCGTGLVFGWMRWFLDPMDEFSIVNHPLEPSTAALHLITAPALVFCVGVLWRQHIWGRFKSGPAARRRTGVLLAVLFFPAALSGYLLQITTESSWRSLWIWTHGTTATAWTVGYVAHQFSSRLERSRRSANLAKS